MNINHGITSATTFQTGKIDIFTYSDSQCINYCTNINNTNGLEIGTTNVCVCKTGYKWNATSSKCLRICNTVTYAVPSNGTICTCLAGYIWDAAMEECVINCGTILYTAGLKSGQIYVCNCNNAKLIWNTGLLRC